MTTETWRRLTQTVDRSGKALEGCTVFMSLFTPGYQKDPKALLELALAVALDKPIYILASAGTPIPENMRRLARGIEVFDPAVEGDLEGASKRLTETFRETLDTPRD